MYNKKKISLVIPCFNEEKGLQELIKTKPAFIDELIVVDNGSTDQTKKIAEQHGAIVVCEKKKGYGQAYRCGLPKANGDIILIIDGDNSYPLRNAENMLSCMEKEDYDLVVGCRYPLTHPRAQPALNQTANRAVSRLIRLLFKINLRDSQSGMMLFKRSLLDKISLFDRGMGFSQEFKI